MTTGAGRTTARPMTATAMGPVTTAWTGGAAAGTVAALGTALAQARRSHRARVSTWRSRVEVLMGQCAALREVVLRFEAERERSLGERDRERALAAEERGRRVVAEERGRALEAEVEAEREARKREAEGFKARAATLELERKLEAERRQAGERTLAEREEEIERLTALVNRMHDGASASGPSVARSADARAADELQLRIRALEARLSAADDYNLSLNAKLVLASEQLEAAERDLRTERAKLSASEGACDRESKLRRRLEDVNNGLRTDLARTQSRVVELEGEVRSKELELGRIARGLEDAQSQAAKHLDALEREKIKNMEAEADRTQTKLDLKHTKEALERSTRELRRKGMFH